MHTQRQSYLLKNRSRSLQFSQAIQTDKRHQYRSAKTRRSSPVCFLTIYSQVPVILPPFWFLSSRHILFIAAAGKQISSWCFPVKALLVNAVFFSSLLILLCISLLKISSTLIVLMSVFLRIMNYYCTTGS